MFYRYILALINNYLQKTLKTLHMIKIEWTPQGLSNTFEATPKDINYWQRVKKPRLPRKLKKKLVKEKTKSPRC